MFGKLHSTSSIAHVMLKSKTFLLLSRACAHTLCFSRIYALSLQEKGSAKAFSYNESQPPVLLHPCLQGYNSRLLYEGKATSSSQLTVSLLLCESQHITR